mgnify:CR=1 FL=1
MGLEAQHIKPRPANLKAAQENLAKVQAGATADELAAGKLDRPLELGGADEIARVGKAMERMRQALETDTSLCVPLPTLR